MPYAYVTEPGAVVRRQRGAIEVTAGGRALGRWPLIHLESLVLIGGVHITTPAMKSLMRHRVAVGLLSSRGGLIGRITPAREPRAALRLAQYALTQNPQACLARSIGLVRAKLMAMVDVLQRHADNHGVAPFAAAIRACRRAADDAAHAGEPKQLRGIEGAAAARYFRGLAQANRSGLAFAGRSTRPPRDPINALLSLGYVLLGQELCTMIEAVGLDPHLGVYHRHHGNRPALALDLLEPYRHLVVDRLTLRLVNRRQYRAGDFRHDASGGVRLDSEAFKRFLADFEQAMQEPAGGMAAGMGTWRDRIRSEVEAFAAEVRGAAQPSGALVGA